MATWNVRGLNGKEDELWQILKIRKVRAAVIAEIKENEKKQQT